MTTEIEPSSMNSPCGVVELFHLPGLYEPFAALSHLLGVALFVGLGVMILRRGGPSSSRRALLTVYVAALVIQFAISSLYHMAVPGTDARNSLRQWDHTAICILIAGTFTPTLGLLYRGQVRWIGLAGVWAAAVGVSLAMGPASKLAEGVCLSFYLALGWSGVAILIDLWRRFGLPFVVPMIVGGSINSLAAVAQYFGWPMIVPHVIHAHEFFHVVVLVGSVLQYCFIWQFAAGAPPTRTPAASRPTNDLEIVDLPAVGPLS